MRDCYQVAKEILSWSWAGVVNEDFIQSLTYIVFCHTTKDLDGEIHSNFTKDPTLHKNTRHGAVTLCCAPKECLDSGATSLTNTNHLESNFIAQSETQRVMNTTMIQIGKSDLYSLSTLSVYCVHGSCHRIVWPSSTNRASHAFSGPTHHCLRLLAVNLTH